MHEQDLSLQLAERIREAADSGTALELRGGGSKGFYGRSAVGEPLEVGGHAGIVHYAPTELVITARAGTPLAHIEQALADAGQMLPFEPPSLGQSATLGGTVACNLSGPRRPYAGAARDFVLGCKLINGKGELLQFGGEVMKNVAGYDVSRLMAGALGTLGLLSELSLKVLPRPELEITLIHEALAEEEAQALMQRLALTPQPISAASFAAGRLHLRVSGTPRVVQAARQQIGGEPLEGGESEQFWCDLREQRHPFFEDSRPLWRLALPADTLPLPIEGDWLLDWGGGQRWLASDADADQIRLAASRAGGHATAWRGGDREGEVFTPLTPALAQIHRRLKAAFDPHGILNPGRMYADL